MPAKQPSNKMLVIQIVSKTIRKFTMTYRKYSAEPLTITERQNREKKIHR